jgi:RecB family endonuclease NucS
VPSRSDPPAGEVLRDLSEADSRLAVVRLIVARCEVSYTGRLTTTLPDSVRLLKLKADGTFMVWSDAGGSSVKPLNWTTSSPSRVDDRDAGCGQAVAGRAYATGILRQRLIWRGSDRRSSVERDSDLAAEALEHERACRGRGSRREVALADRCTVSVAVAA